MTGRISDAHTEIEARLQELERQVPLPLMQSEPIPLAIVLF